MKSWGTHRQLTSGKISLVKSFNLYHTQQFSLVLDLLSISIIDDEVIDQKRQHNNIPWILRNKHIPKDIEIFQKGLFKIDLSHLHFIKKNC